jgi:hypothetical protein
MAYIKIIETEAILSDIEHLQRITWLLLQSTYSSCPPRRLSFFQEELKQGTFPGGCDSIFMELAHSGPNPHVLKLTQGTPSKTIFGKSPTLLFFLFFL